MQSNCIQCTQHSVGCINTCKQFILQSSQAEEESSQRVCTLQGISVFKERKLLSQPLTKIHGFPRKGFSPLSGHFPSAACPVTIHPDGVCWTVSVSGFDYWPCPKQAVSLQTRPLIALHPCVLPAVLISPTPVLMSLFFKSRAP